MQRTTMTTRERIMQRAAIRKSNLLQFEGLRSRLHIETMTELARITGLKPGRVMGLRRGTVTLKPEEIEMFESLIAQRAILAGDATG